MLLLFMMWKPQIELVTRLVGLAGGGLSANPGLVPLALGLQLGLVGLLELPLLMAAIAAAMNGTRVYNTDRVDHGSATAAEQCLDADGGQVPCCEWQTEPWVPAYLAFAFVAMTWSLFLAFQIKMFTVAGATAQWYFQSASASAASGSGGGGTGRYRSRTLTSLRFAVGPSLGSLSGQCGTDTGIYGPSGEGSQRQ
ncbi:hypothetical protein PLESTF_000924800 [Pleodorina starrii]|nr:hypothetical protein PLESTF_000924800 [Pleodorina starrii]